MVCNRDFPAPAWGFLLYLKNLGIALVAADDPDAFTADTPTARLVRQVLGAVAEFEKANLVAKMKRARDKASERAGRRVEGQKGHTRGNPDLVRLAKELWVEGADVAGDVGVAGGAWACDGDGSAVLCGAGQAPRRGSVMAYGPKQCAACGSVKGGQCSGERCYRRNRNDRDYPHVPQLRTRTPHPTGRVSVLNRMR